ncbi:RHS repeat protein [Clostridium estertheticum]|nr:RHS repeat protein [Clostridium estertheticum subsp. laramiense]WAG76110.1 RHS repeat protein [Clostridium estertheticum]
MYVHDNEGNLIEEKTKISVGQWKIEGYTYDSYGRILTKTDGNKTTKSYDKMGNLIRVETPNGGNYSYKYDHMDRLLDIKKSNGIH